jgi:hypothetical protein
VYYARDRLPTADDVPAVVRDGCDTLILGPSWRSQQAATATVVQAAHAAGVRVGVAVDAKDLGSLAADGAWFSSRFEKDRDGIYLIGASFLVAPLEGEFTVGGEKVVFHQDGAFRANAAAWTVCMRALRKLVGPRGFLIGEETASGPNLLSLAEFDLHASANYDGYRWSGTMLRRHKAGAGFAPVLEWLSPQAATLAAMCTDTPIILWPAKNKKHQDWWQLCRRLPAGGFRVESDLLANERRFTTSSPVVHGTLFDGGDGKMLLLLAAERPGSATVKFTIPGTIAAKTPDGQPVPCPGGTLDAGQFAPGQIKAFEIAVLRETGQ